MTELKVLLALGGMILVATVIIGAALFLLFWAIAGIDYLGDISRWFNLLFLLLPAYVVTVFVGTLTVLSWAIDEFYIEEKDEY